jgi:hypothetical protein
VKTVHRANGDTIGETAVLAVGGDYIGHEKTILSDSLAVRKRAANRSASSLCSLEA